jgi:hypothetical protein
MTTMRTLAFTTCIAWLASEALHGQDTTHQPPQVVKATMRGSDYFQ